MENNMINFMKRAAERSGFRRDYFVEKNIPTTPSNIEIIPFFGDLRSTCILSSFLLKAYKEQNPSKYIVLASWPGFRALFPYVDEYWTISDNSSIISLASGANNFYNDADASVNYTRNLIENFENVISSKDWKLYFDNGFTKKYWETLGIVDKDFKAVKRYLPDISSVNRLSENFKKELGREGSKVLIHPVKKIRSWQKNQVEYIPISIDFWVKLIERLLSEGLIPVVYQSSFTYDLSPKFADKCVYLVSSDISHVICAMRAIGCVLDIYSGISRLANIARCPYVCVDERNRFVNHKEYELDDLGTSTPKQYIFSFSTQILSGTINELNDSLLDGLVIRLKSLFSTSDINQLPSTLESNESVSYNLVREKKNKRLGVHFIRKH